MPTREAIFHSTIYPAEAVQEAAEAFADFAAFELVPGDDAITVRAELEERSINQVWGEFQNYVLINS